MQNDRHRIVCCFLIPVLRDSDRTPQRPILWRLLQDALVKTFGAITGPEMVLYYRLRDSVPGLWTPEDSDEAVEDESRRYTVAVPEERLDDLRSLLRRAGNSFDQRVMYLEVAGKAELLEVRAQDGFLEI